jgi:hypothetical protein
MSLSALDAARLGYIPKGGNWTHLPNIEVPLEDGTTTTKL